YLSRLIKDLTSGSAKDRQSVAVVVLAYTLAPEARHPTQLLQASAALDHLANSTGRSPSNIFLSGDSAGGNLALAVLSHILHPHPDVPAIKLDQALCGILLYSPWTGFSTDYRSFDELRLDVMSPLALRKWSAMFLDKANTTDPETDPGPVSGDGYTEACKNDASWWHGAPKAGSDVFIFWGGDEVLKDPIVEFSEHFKAGWEQGRGDASRVVLLEGPGEAHVAPIIEIMSPGSAVKGSSQNAIEAWLKARLQ
ncbi:alpha/beta-hydrolase, partial [Setomelanomma holmii]